MAGEKILIVDDEEFIHKIIVHSLSRDGYIIIKTYNGAEALKAIEEHSPDLVLLDIVLPEMDGIELCREIKKLADIPVLFITSRDTSHDIAIGFGAGGDDYIKKPFDPVEMSLRVKVHLRRSRAFPAKSKDKDVLTFAGLEIDFAGHIVKVRGEAVKLTAKEFDLLALLARKPNYFFSPDQLIACLWNQEDSVDNRSLMSHVSKLRKKIEDDPSNPRYIISARGVGYKFSESV